MGCSASSLPVLNIADEDSGPAVKPPLTSTCSVEEPAYQEEEKTSTKQNTPESTELRRQGEVRRNLSDLERNHPNCVVHEAEVDRNISIEGDTNCTEEPVEGSASRAERENVPGPHRRNDTMHNDEVIRCFL